ncbi:MAG: acetate/propionate family kinase, partial [Burkholderiales bacterium]
CALAPLHQPHNLSAIRAVAQHRPQLRQVACFDTEFHQSQPELARLFPLPKALSDEGIKRYGFHGLSYEFIAQRLPAVIGEAAEGRVVVAHLGNGASLCAMTNRRSIATTMGFTALDGLMMGTRTGAIDPGVLLYLMDAKKLGSRDIAKLLYHESGLLGVSGVSQDMRTLLSSHEPRARLAVELYVYRIVRELGSLAAALGGLDAMVFTAGIGEHAAPVRRSVCETLSWLGVELDPAANKVHGPIISTAASRVTVAVIPTNEEEMIARHTLRLVRR